MKRKTIRNHRDFLMHKDDPVVHTDIFVVKAKTAKIPGDARYGLIVSKKIFKLAVERNRVKRMLRDWIFFNEDLMLSELDYIFIPKHQIINIKRDSGRYEVGCALKKIVKINSKNDK